MDQRKLLHYRNLILDTLVPSLGTDTAALTIFGTVDAKRYAFFNIIPSSCFGEEHNQLSVTHCLHRSIMRESPGRNSVRPGDSMLSLQALVTVIFHKAG
jgi:hypothetical protein